MKYTLCLIAITVILSCKGQEGISTDTVPYGKSPVTPSQTILIEKSLQKYEDLEILAESVEGAYTLRTFSLNGEPFEGWAYQIFLDTDHRFRYTMFEKGLAVWQIGYYDNGDLGHDFHMKDGLNYGSQRMWRKGGGLYIDTYFLEGEVQHGLQYRWHSNGTLAREALFNNGELSYEVLFDKNENITDKKGKIPANYQTL